MSESKFLYGSAYDDEHLWNDIEQVLDEHPDIDDNGPGAYVVDVWKWSVAPAEHHVPSADLLVDWLIEHVAEHALVDEYYTDNLESQRSAIEDLAKAFLGHVAERLNEHSDYQMAGELVANLKVRVTLWADRSWHYDVLEDE